MQESVQTIETEMTLLTMYMESRTDTSSMTCVSTRALALPIIVAQAGTVPQFTILLVVERVAVYGS